MLWISSFFIPIRIEVSQFEFRIIFFEVSVFEIDQLFVVFPRLRFSQVDHHLYAITVEAGHSISVEYGIDIDISRIDILIVFDEVRS